MKISGNCYIAKKFDSNTNTFSKEPNFGKTDKRAWGKISWADQVQNKAGEKVKAYTTKNFICFGANISIIESLLDKLIYIEGFLRTRADKFEGKNVEEIVINKVDLGVYEKTETQKSGERIVEKLKKGEQIQQNFVEFQDDEIPW